MGAAAKSENPVLDAALGYYRRGWCVVPIKAGTKTPRIKWRSYQTERPCESQVRKWFSSGKNGVGIICGPVSGGLTVIDFDDAELYRAWAAEHSDLAAILPTVRTGRGCHVYCRTEHTKTKPLDGIDVKASGYVLTPPSIHPSGLTYQWINPLEGNLQTVSLEDFGLHLTQETYEPKETHETQETQAIQETQRSRGVTGDDVMPLLTGLCGSDILEDVAAAIIETLPDKIGQRNKRIFLLAQRLKSVPAYTKSKPEALKEIVRVWHKLAQLVINTKPFELTWIDFVAAWPKVVHLRMSGALGAAMRAAKAKIEKGQGLACQYESYEVRLLLQTCYELQRDDGCFEMGCRKAGEVMKQSHETGRNVMELLEADGWCRKIQKGYSRVVEVNGKKTTEKKATEYRWIKK